MTMLVSAFSASSLLTLFSKVNVLLNGFMSPSNTKTPPITTRTPKNDNKIFLDIYFKIPKLLLVYYTSYKISLVYQTPSFLWIIKNNDSIILK